MPGRAPNQQRMLRHSPQASTEMTRHMAEGGGGGEAVIARLSGKISGMIKGDRAESLLLLISH